MNNTVLKEKDAAIIFSEEGVSIAIPNQTDDELVPDYVKICVGIAALWMNPETQSVLEKMVIDLFDEQLKSMKEKEEDGN